MCGKDQYVSNHNCVSCPPGTTNDPGDDIIGGDTQCTAVLCNENQHVKNNKCISCLAGMENSAGDDSSGNNTYCSIKEIVRSESENTSCSSWFAESGNQCDDGYKRRPGNPNGRSKGACCIMDNSSRIAASSAILASSLEALAIARQAQASAAAFAATAKEIADRKTEESIIAQEEVINSQKDVSDAESILQEYNNELETVNQRLFEANNDLSNIRINGDESQVSEAEEYLEVTENEFSLAQTNVINSTNILNNKKDILKDKEELLNIKNLDASDAISSSQIANNNASQALSNMSVAEEAANTASIAAVAISNSFSNSDDLDPVDCVLSDWSDWSICSKSCNGGVQERVRNVEIPSVGTGNVCDINMLEIRPCNTMVCADDIDDINCVMDDWSEWEPCSVSCGGGIQKRRKNIITPSSGNGVPCNTITSETRECNTQTCGVDITTVTDELDPGIDCIMGEWSDWGKCTKVCGGGEQKRVRNIDTPASAGGSCSAYLTETRECNLQDCDFGLNDIDCEMGEWSGWGNCSVDCDGGIQIRTRDIKTPSQGDGEVCGNKLIESQECNLHKCVFKVKSSLSFGGDVSELEAGTEEKEMFIQEFKVKMAEEVGDIDPEDIVIDSLESGSIIVNFSIVLSNLFNTKKIETRLKEKKESNTKITVGKYLSDLSTISTTRVTTSKGDRMGYCYGNTYGKDFDCTPFNKELVRKDTQGNTQNSCCLDRGGFCSRNTNEPDFVCGKGKSLKKGSNNIVGNTVNECCDEVRVYCQDDDGIDNIDCYNDSPDKLDKFRDKYNFIMTNTNDPKNIEITGLKDDQKWLKCCVVESDEGEVIRGRFTIKSTEPINEDLLCSSFSNELGINPNRVSCFLKNEDIINLSTNNIEEPFNNMASGRKKYEYYFKILPDKEAPFTINDLNKRLKNGRLRLNDINQTLYIEITKKSKSIIQKIFNKKVLRVLSILFIIILILFVRSKLRYSYY